ncbi:phosphatase PAP2 family protein [Methylophilus sp. TWE2]|uniref:phosphatase PAP2 family protein n=1 Tax=Methylophilus sp. TWE2 TaxID=1662285 RepID=UPI0006714FDC|nr:phosphatase PAP2 family protein [Methylophilus sp. TWE2]
MVTAPWLIAGSIFLAVAGIMILMLVWVGRMITLYQPVISHAPLFTHSEERHSSPDYQRLRRLGLIVLASAGTLFALIAENVINEVALTLVDLEVAQWLHAHSTTMLTQCLLVITHLHDPWILSSVAGMITLYYIGKKRWYAALSVLLIVQGAMLLNLLAKHMFQRARPTFDDPLVTLVTYSFPSGHVVASTVFYGTLAVLLISQKSALCRAVYILPIAIAMVFLVAFSRMYLGAHYLSDVLAAFLEAVIWIALCLTPLWFKRL